MKILKFAIMMLFLSACFFSCQKEPQKIWLHRANDVEKARYFKDRYAGLEIDITYVDSLQTFLILHGGGHVEPNPISFEQWLNGLEDVNELKLWLDFKNLDNDNKMLILNKLNYICSEYKIKKDNLIVESWAASCLPLFQDSDYQTSYYIPSFNPKKSSAEDIQRFTNEIRKAVDKNNLTTISGYYYQYQFMRDSFPEMNVLIWYNLDDTIVRNRYIELANNDEKVQVLLVADEIPLI